MRNSRPARLSVVVVLALASSSTLAADAVVHVSENVSGGEVVARLETLLQLEPADRVRLTGPERACFRVDAERRLVVAPGVRLDHEQEAMHECRIEIESTRQPDTLRSRFVGAIQRDRADKDAVENLNRTVRQVRLQVLVDDAPEAPQLLATTFQLPRHSAPTPGESIGRVLAIDPDKNERLQFELLNDSGLFRIDAESGELSLCEGRQLPPVSSLQVCVRVTDGAGLDNTAIYRVRVHRYPLSGSTAPPVTEVAAMQQPDQQSPTIESTDTPSHVFPDPGPATAGDRTPEAAPGTPRQTVVAEQSDSQVPASGVVVTRSASSQFLDRWSGWLITGLAVLCVVIIVVSGVREAILAGVDEQSLSIAELRGAEEPVNEAPVQRSPSEISDILARLDAVIGRHATTDPIAESLPNSSGCQATDSTSVDELMTQALSSAGLLSATSDSTASLESVADTATAVLEKPVSTTQLASSSLSVSKSADFGQQRQSDRAIAPERERIEQFREISRMTNRADIGRHHRERMRHEWMSAGLTALACIVTGAVCMITECFGRMSAPMGSFLFSVSAVLLMRRSLYPQVPRRRATDGNSAARDLSDPRSASN